VAASVRPKAKGLNFLSDFTKRKEKKNKYSEEKAEKGKKPPEEKINSMPLPNAG
jgi:hypothetical protein